MSSDRRRLRFDLDDQAADRYPRVPFAVDGEGSVEVHLSVVTEGAVVDLGCEGPAGWRGWSGGARTRFAITPDAATPGYVPGPLEPGEWAVVLGLHRVPAAGIEVEVTISLPATGPVEAEPPAPPRPDVRRGSARGLPSPAGTTWLACDFHAHSTHSDGDQSLDQLAARAVASGLDLLAVTDHNTVSHHPHLPAVGARYDLPLIPGQEVTTARGHANAFGDIGWIDFRTPADTWLDQVEARGGLLSVNHPIEGDCSWQHPLTRIPPVLELWHIGWFRDVRSDAMWAFWNQWRHDVSVVGGGDFHIAGDGRPPGLPTTWVAAADRSPDAVLEAVEAGRTAIAWAAWDSPALLRFDDEVVAVDAEGTVLVDIDGRRRPVHGDRVALAADTGGAAGAGQAPYRLESATGELLAISP